MTDSDAPADSPAAPSGSADAAGTTPTSDDPTPPSAPTDPATLTIDERSLHPRTRYLWVATALLTGGAVGLVIFGLHILLLRIGRPLLVAAGIGGLVAVAGSLHALLRYRVWRYEVREDALYLERGVLTRVRTVVPLVRMQHVDTARSPIQRTLGLSSVVVYTAGSRGADVTIPGLAVERGEDLQRRLKQLAIAAGGDPAV